MSIEEKGSDPIGSDSILDRAISEIRDEAVSPEAVDDAAGRVWARLAGEAGSTSAASPICAQFQAQMPAFRGGTLSPARAALLEDHTHECPACRKALFGVSQPVIIRPRRSPSPAWKWAIAAALLAAVGMATLQIVGRIGVPSGARATVASLDGTLYRITGSQNIPLAPGASIADEQAVRTARGSEAVIRLSDGSRVEMRERTQLTVTERREGMTVRLAAGSVIVEAAKQHSRHLYVATDDCLVSVTGTVFSVNHDIQGSRVAVIEGLVKVTRNGTTKLLYPGDQTETSANLTPIPVREEIAWSRNADQYDSVLSELQNLTKKLQALPGPGLRYGTRLLDLAPTGTTFYAAIPNLGTTLGEASRIFHQQLSESEPLRQWWAEKMQSTGGEAKLDEMLARVEAFSAYLGPEIAVAFNRDSPVVMAQVTRNGLREFLQTQLQNFPGTPVRIVDNPAHAAPASGDAFYVYIGPDLVIAAPRLPQLQAVARTAQSGSDAFSNSAFHARIAQAYAKGVAWLLAADVHAVAPNFGGAQYLIVERKDISGQTENRAVLTFAQARTGVASWLAEPAPIRALDFVSSNASFAAAAAIKSPAALLDEAFALASKSNAAFPNQLAEVEAAAGVNIREDLARPLGGELAVAMDGPLLPVPSWKLVLEVYDPPRFEQALETLAARASQNGLQVHIDRENSGGRTYYALRGTRLPFDVQYVYDGGFLIAAPNRDLLVRALELRTTGNMLAHSAKFTALLPHDQHTGFSAMVYHDLGTALAPLAGSMALAPEQKRSLLTAAAAAGPSLVVAYGEPDRIELASAGTFFGLRLEQLLGLGGRH